MGSREDRTRKDSDKEIYYEDHSLTVTPKGINKELPKGAYKWKIRAVDENGATVETSERILLVKTHNTSFTSNPSNSSISSLPLSLTYLGSYPINISNLDPSNIKTTYSINTLTPILNGITYSNYQVKLDLTRNGKLVLTKQTTSKDSRFNINLTSQDKLSPGEYLIKLSSSNSENYVELPSFKLKVGGVREVGEVRGIKADNINNGKIASSQTPRNDNFNNNSSQPTANNTQQPFDYSQGKPTKPKHCFLFFCW